MTLAPGEMRKILMVSIDAPGHYSLALPLLKSFAECDDNIREHVSIRIQRIIHRGAGTRITRELLGAVIRWRPQVVAFSCYVWNARAVARCCRWLRRVFPRVIIVLGGQEICPPFDEVTQRYPAATVLIAGEGERPFRNLLGQLLEHGLAGFERARGITYRDPDGGWHATPVGEPLTNLDEIPSPYLNGDIVLPDQLRMGAMIELTRGCPMRCGFCFEANRLPKPKTYSFERVAEEIRWLRSRGHRRFHILDPILCFGRRLQQFHEMLSGLDMNGTTISAEVHAESIQGEDLPYLEHVTDFDVGLQTITPEALAIMKRPWSRERFEQGFEVLRATGRIVSCYLLIGLPGDNLNTFRAAMDYTMSLRPTKLFCNPLLVLRGTPLRLNAAMHGLQYRSDPPYEASGCATFPPEQLRQAHVLGKFAMNSYNDAAARQGLSPADGRN